MATVVQTSLRREFLPHGTPRAERSADLISQGIQTGFDWPVTQAGVVGDVTVYYATSLGAQGQAQAEQLLGEVIGPFVDMEGYFGIDGAPINVIVAPLSGNNDGTGGAYHYGCDFTSGGTMYCDATFANTTENPLQLLVLLYVAELSECFMGAQSKGWGCGSSNGEALSRYMGDRETAPGTMPGWGVTAPTWANDGYPDWVDNTEGTDRDYDSIGCGMVYLYWMRSLGYSALQITQAGGATFADNYKTLTGKTTAWADLKAALSGKTVTSDNPFVSPTGSWHHNDIGGTPGATPPAGNAIGYTFVSQATQHVNYRGTNNHVCELWWNGSWHFNDLTAAAGGAPNAQNNPHGYMFDAQGTQHVNYLGTDSHVHELWWNGSWHHNDLTAAAGGAPNAVGSPRGYMFDAQGTQHVNYLGTDGHVHELWWNGSWHHNDLTVAAAGAPNSVGDPNGYMFNQQGTQHVNYRGTDNHIHELWWDGSWHHNDLTVATGSPNAAGDPMGYIFNDQPTQHVIYLGTDGHVHELWWNGSWHHNDLTVAAGAPNAASKPAPYVYELQGTQHVIHRGTDNHVHELWWNGSWHHNDLTAAGGAAPNATGNPMGYIFAGQDTQHVVYAGSDNSVHELWWG